MGSMTYLPASGAFRGAASCGSLWTGDGVRRPQSGSRPQAAKPTLSWSRGTSGEFAIITFEVSPETLRAHLHPRFEPLVIPGAAGKPRALISVAPFLDTD
jgi:hypothetical protein